MNRQQFNEMLTKQIEQNGFASVSDDCIMGMQATETDTQDLSFQDYRANLFKELDNADYKIFSVGTHPAVGTQYQIYGKPEYTITTPYASDTVKDVQLILVTCVYKRDIMSWFELTKGSKHTWKITDYVDAMAAYDNALEAE